MCHHSQLINVLFVLYLFIILISQVVIKMNTKLIQGSSWVIRYMVIPLPKKLLKIRGDLGVVCKYLGSQYLETEVRRIISSRSSSIIWGV